MARLTRRGRYALALGALTYLAAWGFGSAALYPVAVGLVLAAVGARLWLRLAARPVRLRRAARVGRHFEGDSVMMELELELSGFVPPPALRVVERVARLGERETHLGGAGRRRSARYALRSVPRGRYRLEEAWAVAEDPFGLARAEVLLESSGSLLVYPRHVELERLFSERGLREPGGRRLLLHRTSGFDLHHVREYEQGESLRRVHWPSTARRGRLMVKELEDSPRDEVAVVLDAEAVGHLGEPPESSFDVQVRAAASLLHAHAQRGRRAVLVITGRRTETVPVASLAGDWSAAVNALAAAEAEGQRPLAGVLSEHGAAVQALELVVVTASVPAALAERLVQRAAAHRVVSVVYVDRASFAGRREVAPGLLRLQAAGVPVSVVRRGDDLRAVLGPRAAQAAHG